jgi:hypothetical protein
MRRASSHSCAVPGCSRTGLNQISIRCRVSHSGSAPKGKGRTGAIWSPETGAFLCDRHALDGARITVLFEPDDSRKTTVKVIAGHPAAERTTPIKQP